MNKKQKRFAIVISIFIVFGGAIALTLAALRTSITYFYTPSELAALDDLPERAIRLGGLVADGSVKYGARSENGNALVSFVVTDGGAETSVSFEGILPDLFREGQGVVVEGSVTENGALTASNVLAKHDENYMPKEVVDALKEQGRWNDETTE